ncbi:hypothetical protein NVP1214O_65 [Vibrio phage 1.214.O._10N.222.54.F11]|nr:hypothetical protein NVP1214O_65 [Vibrio phage 1.214.O._10N.222.54.F11]
MAYVYVIKCDETHLCKIGRSRDVEARLKQIESSSGLKCHIAYVSQSLTNAPLVESVSHNKCSGRKVGEWFSCATNQAISCVKDACREVGEFGEEEFKSLNSYDMEYLAFWAAADSFINQNPLSVIKYALDKFGDHFSDEVLSICNRAYKVGSGGEDGDFEDMLDVKVFFEEMTKSKSSEG